MLDREPTDEAREAAHDLAAQHPENDGVVHVLSSLERSGFPTKRLVPVGIAVLEARPDHPGVGYLWSLLHNRAPADPRVANVGEWLVRRHPEAEIGEILDALEEQHTPQEHQRLVDAALAYTGTNSFEHLWPKEWDKKPGDPRLVEAGRRYLAASTRAARPGFGYIWPRLWQHDANDDLRRVALAFLERHPDHGGFGHVFAPLWEQTADRKALSRAAWHFLHTQPDHKAYARVWLVLWNDGTTLEERNELADLGFRHIETHISGESFPWIWQLLWKAQVVPRDDLTAPAMRYLQMRPFPAGFSTVFERLWGIEALRPQIRRLGLAFVYSSSPKASSTVHLLLRDDPDDVKLTQRAVEVLRWSPYRPRDFGQLWQLLHDRLRSHGPAKDALVRAATALVEHPWDGAAPLAWAYLFETLGASEMFHRSAQPILKHHGAAMPAQARETFERAGHVVPHPPRSVWHWFRCPKCWEDSGCYAQEEGRFTVHCTCNSCLAPLVVRRVQGNHVEVAADEDAVPEHL